MKINSTSGSGIYRPPTFTMTLAIVAIGCASFQLFMYLGRVDFDCLTAQQHRMFAQWGALLSFMAAIVAMIGLFHDPKVLERVRCLKSELKSLREQEKMLNNLQDELKHDLSVSLRSVAELALAREKELQPLSQYPESMRSIYWLAVLILAIAAIAQLVGIA